MIPLSKLGIGIDDKELLSNRLFPEVNKIFLANLAKSNNVDINHVENLDYSNHPVYKRDRWMANRLRRAEYLKDRIDKGQFDITPYEEKYKTFEEAIAAEPDKHVIMEERSDRDPPPADAIPKVKKSPDVVIV